MVPIQLEHYIDPDGHCRFEAWLKDLDTSIRMRVTKRIQRMAGGHFGDHRQLSGDLYELRMHFGAGYRIYFGVHKGTLILLLGGGDKSTQSKDIMRARYDWNSYLEATP